MKWAILCRYSDGSGAEKVPLELLDDWDDRDLAQVMRIIHAFARCGYCSFNPENIHLIADLDSDEQHA